MIMEILKPNLKNLHACSLAARGFRAVVQPLLGRHISVNEPSRVKECVQLLEASGFQHVTSLSLGITTKRTVLEEYWNDYLAILKVFAPRKSLACLWLWEIPFFFLQPRQKKMFKEAVLALSSSVTELGLYGCHFSCYEEMVSFVRAFPHCDKLSIQDCVTGGRGSKNLLADFPQYKLSIVNLDITASSTRGSLIIPSGFIEDAELEVSSLCKLACDLRWVTGTRRIISATSESPVRQLRFSSHYPGGFQGTHTHVSLSVIFSLTYRYQRVRKVGITGMALGIAGHRTHASQSQCGILESRTRELSQAASLDQSPNHLRLPHAPFVQYPRWDSFASILSDRNTFPCLKTVHVCLMYRSQRLSSWNSTKLLAPLKSLKSSGIKVVYLGGR